MIKKQESSNPTNHITDPNIMDVEQGHVDAPTKVSAS